MSQQQQQQQQQGNLTEDDAVNSILMSVSYFEHEECVWEANKRFPTERND